MMTRLFYACCMLIFMASVVCADQSLYVSWQPSPEESLVTEYILYKGKDESADIEVLRPTETALHLQAMADLGLTPETQQLCLRVRAVNQYGISGFSNAACVDVTPGKPEAPMQLTIVGGNTAL